MIVMHQASVNLFFVNVFGEEKVPVHILFV